MPQSLDASKRSCVCVCVCLRVRVGDEGSAVQSFCCGSGGEKEQTGKQLFTLILMTWGKFFNIYENIFVASVLTVESILICTIRKSFLS